MVRGVGKLAVKLVPKVVKGWKQSENNRFGHCLVMQFVNDKTGKVLFEYAPTLQEKDVWGVLFNAVFELDDLHKKAIAVCSKLDSDFKVGVNNDVCGVVSK